MSSWQHDQRGTVAWPIASPQRQGDRVEAAVLLLVALAVIVVPALLHPDPSGYGTHTQCLLLPCFFRQLTGVPCPLCGMTTSLAHMARGELVAAFNAHLLGPLLYVLAFLTAGRSLWALIKGMPAFPQWLQGPKSAQLMLAILLTGWVGNIAMSLLR